MPNTPIIKNEVKTEEPKQEEPRQETSASPEKELPEESAPKPPKPSREERRLQSNLDGGYWQCNQEHGRRLRVRTTKIQDEEDLTDTWDNISNLEQEEGILPKRD